MFKSRLNQSVKHRFLAFFGPLTVLKRNTKLTCLDEVVGGFDLSSRRSRLSLALSSYFRPVRLIIIVMITSTYLSLSFLARASVELHT